MSLLISLSPIWFSEDSSQSQLSRKDQPGENLFVNEILLFDDSCREKKEPLTRGKDDRHVIEVIFGIYESKNRENSCFIRK